MQICAGFTAIVMLLFAHRNALKEARTTHPPFLELARGQTNPPLKRIVIGEAKPGMLVWIATNHMASDVLISVSGNHATLSNVWKGAIQRIEAKQLATFWTRADPPGL